MARLFVKQSTRVVFLSVLFLVANFSATVRQGYSYQLDDRLGRPRASAVRPSAAELLHQAWDHAEGSRQCFGFSSQQSIARDSFNYPDGIADRRASANRGDLINLKCDSVVCPNPEVTDCYMKEDICSEDEWCQLEDQVRFGPWAMAGGETPMFSLEDCKEVKEQGFHWIYEQVCRNETHWGPWEAVRGRCSTFRQEQQSCNAYFAAANPDSSAFRLGDAVETAQPKQRVKSINSAAEWQSNINTRHKRSLLAPVNSYHTIAAVGQSGANQAASSQAGGGAVQAAADEPAPGFQSQLWPHYVVDDDGRPPVRPQLCAPGLACTGDLEPTPNTCVKVRPPNVCYQGPWWDSSSWCKVGGKANNAIYGGLPLHQLKLAAQALLIQLPVEHFVGPTNPKFWHSQSADVARGKIQGILRALWPEQYKSSTRFPLDIPDPRNAGKVDSRAWNATAEEALGLYRQANKVWSTIHTLIHNAKDPMPWTQVMASRSLAVWLRQHFMCCNCRGMWANHVLNRIGLPPKSSSREDHTQWWWRAHNMVSDHAASTRGGHPWIWPAMTDQEMQNAYAQYGGHLKCQNPWFLPYEFAAVMWRIASNSPTPSE